MVYSMFINSSACISFSFAKLFPGKLITALIYLISLGLAPAYVHSSECIGVVTAGGGQDFWGEVQTGAHKAAEELGIKAYVRGPADEINTSGQRSMIRSMQNHGCKVMVMAPNSQERLQDVEQLLSQGIPTVYVDRDIGGKRVSVIKTDNFTAGRTAGVELANALGGQGEILLYRMDPNVLSTTQREEGFIEGAKSNGLDIVTEVYLGTTIEEARSNAYQTLAKLKGIDGIFTPNESTTLALLATLQRHSNNPDLVHIGFDTHPMMLDATRSGKMLGAIAQDPRRMGYLGVIQAHRVMQGKPFNETVDVQVSIINRDNIDFMTGELSSSD